MLKPSPKKSDKPSDPQLEQINIAPHSIEAEQAVLGALMLSSEQWDNVRSVYNRQISIILHTALSMNR